LPIEQQIVQAAHATLEAGLKAGASSLTFKETTSLILLEASNEEKLLQAHEHIINLGIDCALFYEPDDNLGYTPSYTSFSTVPITAEHRHHFKKYRLFKSEENHDDM
jgi:hypothetical protein